MDSKLSERLRQLLSASGTDGRNPSSLRDIVPPTDLVFDDSPLDGAIYGASSVQESAANIFREAAAQLNGLIQSEFDTDEDRVRALCDIVSKHSDISLPDYQRVRLTLERMTQRLASKVLSDPESGSDALLLAIYRLARARKDREFQHASGNTLYRTWERIGKHNEAREVLCELIELARDQGDATRVGILVNNCAFQYWLAGEWREAADGFLDAAHQFEELGDTKEHANAFANYWAAIFELSALERVAVMEPALRRTARILRENDDLRERKSLVYLAKIHEARHEFAQAVPLMERAVQIDSAKHTPYLEPDQQLLDAIYERLSSNSKGT